MWSEKDCVSEPAAVALVCGWALVSIHKQILLYCLKTSGVDKPAHPTTIRDYSPGRFWMGTD